MTNKIDKLIQTNSFYRNIFDLKPKDKNKVTKEDSEHFRPKECKGWEEGITVNDLFENPCEKDKKVFHKDWLKEIYQGKKCQSNFAQYLYECGYDKNQAKRIIQYSKENIDRQKLWASENEKVGKDASLLVNLSIGLAVVKELLDFDSAPQVLKLFLDFLYGLSRGIRNNRQYYLYDRIDDDANCNRYQKDIYGNKIAGSLGSLSMIFERKINPYLFPIVELLEEKMKLSLKRLISLPTNLWWRVRMLSHVNQRFFTDLINYLFHSIPAVLGVKRSKKVIEEIKEKGNLKLSYLLERHCKNAGIKNKEEQTFKNLIRQTIKHIKNLFNSDTEIQKSSTEKLGATVAPALGIYGTFAMGVGSAGCGKIFNFIFQTALVSQQFIYFPKFVIPALIEGKELKSKISKEQELKKERYAEEEINKLKKLSKKKINLAYIGMSAMVFNLLNLFFKGKDQFTSVFLNKFAKIIDEVSQQLILKFFSQRRHLKGLKFKLVNRVLYTLPV